MYITRQSASVIKMGVVYPWVWYGYQCIKEELVSFTDKQLQVISYLKQLYH